MAKGIQYQLWTPIANAYEAYRRRLIKSPTAIYEHTWRLIHIEESLVVTLSAALATRLLVIWQEQPNMSEQLNKLRTLITGIKQDDAGELDFDSDNVGCLRGSIGAWLDFLSWFLKLDEQFECSFVVCVKDYLEKVPDENPSLAFLTAWQRIESVKGFKGNDLKRLDRLKAINSLRNKLAHVPISHRIFRDLYEGLRQEVLSLLTPSTDWQKKCVSDDPEIKKWHPPFYGLITNELCFSTGLYITQSKDIDEQKIYWKWWNQPNNENSIQWLASPFVHIDDELGVSLLFRVNHFRDDLKEKRGEYHRFAAELEPVREQLIPQDTIQAWIPAKIPSSTTELLDGNCVGEAVNDPAEVKEELQEELKDKTPYELRSAAVEAFWKRDYLRAMTIFDELAKIHNSNEYNHVAMYQHGVAMWNTAEQLGAEGHIYDLHQRISWLKNAVELLKEASQHRNSDYSAKALYERSKALCRLSHLVTDDNAFFTQACEDAEKAANSVYERAYISWYQRLVERGC